ncbi:phosphoribosyltransferase domain-containing protein [Sphingomonas sp. GM_Shp_2]|uniref:phosphoribosyltransferase domain-containing protein n=1 Tax=Sphingomonas sp. GM_Shp_2 TaxID=2937380 RepID=UPI00226AF660|nr:phosphoribosyltransferase domain-containing protein [Sphingomonas sp. GM_Shp_2]
MMAAGGQVSAAAVSLSTGELRVEVTGGDPDWPLARLCGFAARRNPRRGFLVVSKVLGRHWPARPGEMRAAVRALAARLPGDLAGPIVVMGLAETAVCLGQTLHEEMARGDALFLHSTRQRIDHPLLARFEEPHSHASAHLVYEPVEPGFEAPRTLVLVDDEVSTGTTLTNLARVLVARWPSVERIVVATLTDWSGGGWLAAMPRPATIASLLQGRLDWTPGGVAEDVAGFEAAAGTLGVLDDPVNHGRLGRRDSDVAGPDREPAVHGPLRIVGTGEFTYAPFRLAERLEAAGLDVVVQATSRSPARIGGALACALCFDDNYGTGVPNFLYNADAADGRTTWICHETPDVDPALVSALDAETLRWSAR